MITVADLVNDNSSNMLQRIEECVLDARSAYKIAKFMKEYNEERTLAYSSVRNAIAKLCELDGAGNPVANQDGNLKIKAGIPIEDAQKQLNDLYTTEVKLSNYIPLSMLDGMQISAKELLTIEPFINENE